MINKILVEADFHDMWRGAGQTMWKVSQIFREPGINPSKHKTYIIRTVKEHTFTICGSPMCN